MGKRKLLRHSTLSVEEGLSLIAQAKNTSTRIDVTHNSETVSVQIGLLGSVLFMNKGVACIGCQRTGNMFAVEKTLGIHASVFNDWHLNLYHRNEFGQEVMMTTDHILAKSSGGTDDLHNLQPLCIVCNMRKGKMSMDHFLQASRKFHKADLDAFNSFRNSIEDIYGIKSLTPEEYGELLDVTKELTAVATLDDDRCYKMISVRGVDAVVVYSKSRLSILNAISKKNGNIRELVSELQSTPPKWAQSVTNAKDIYDMMLRKIDVELSEIISSETDKRIIANKISLHPLRHMLFARWSSEKPYKLSMVTWHYIKKNVVKLQKELKNERRLEYNNVD